MTEEGGNVEIDDTKDGKPLEAKKTPSQVKKKFISKSRISSKASLKKYTGSTMSSLIDTSTSSLDLKKQSEFERLSKMPKYQNTYRLDSKKPFKSNEVFKIIEAIVEKEASEFSHYESVLGSKIAQSIAAEVRNAVRSQNYDRYKICVLVYLGEKKLQGFQAAFRALWDHERDGWSTYYYQCRSYFLSCSCFGLYHD